MDSFHLDIEQIKELGSKRILIEAKLREIIPDIGDDKVDSIAKKLESLNQKFEHSEKKASMNFRLDVQQLAHGKNPFKSQRELDAFIENYNTLNQAIDRILEKIRADKKDTGGDKIEVEEMKKESKENLTPKYTKISPSELSWWHFLALLAVFGFLSRFCSGGAMNQNSSTDSSPYSPNDYPNTEIVGNIENQPQNENNSINKNEPITSLNFDTITFLQPQNTFDSPVGWSSNKTTQMYSTAPGTPGISLNSQMPVQQQSSDPQIGWNSNPNSQMYYPAPGTPGRSLNSPQGSSGYMATPIEETEEGETGAMSQ